MEQKEFLYEGKAKQVYATDQEDLIIIHYKDDATAFNGIKKAQISNKGSISWPSHGNGPHLRSICR